MATIFNSATDVVDLDDLFDSPLEEAGDLTPGERILSGLVVSGQVQETAEITALRHAMELERCQLEPFPFQVIGIHKLITHPYFGLFDEMGAGKTLQSIVAACILFLRGEIDRVITVAPAAVRSVWFDPEFGELQKHLFPNISARILQFHSKRKEWDHPAAVPVTHKKLEWVVTNYELLRSKLWLKQLFPYVNKKTLLIADESSALKNWKAEQTKAVRELRKRVGRFVMLNGTPIANDPMDLFAQGNLLHPSILDCGFITHYRARYAEMGGYLAEIIVGRTPDGKLITKKVPTQVVGWKNLDDLTGRFKPHVLRRLKADVLKNLPRKLDPVTITVPLSETTWTHYKAMRDDMVTWLSDQKVAMTNMAMTKAMRLAQITSGFVGGVESLDDEPENELAEVPDFMQGIATLLENEPEALSSLLFPSKPAVDPTFEIGREKLDAFLDWVEMQLENDPALKLLVWSRFVPELHRTVDALRERFPKMDTSPLVGGQKKSEERDSIKLLDPRYAPTGAATVVSTSKGSMGFTFTACHTVARLSRSYSLFQWLQSDDRVHRPGQTRPISYTDWVAVGPRGQRTVDSIILAALLSKENVARWTTEAWVSKLGVAA